MTGEPDLAAMLFVRMLVYQLNTPVKGSLEEKACSEKGPVGM
jgi:hypothetical protein